MPAESLLFEIGAPDVKRLHSEFQRAGGLSTVSVRRDNADRIRYCRWTGRCSDYRKHRRYLGKDPVPWENAWDSRITIADDLITDLVDVLMNAFKRAQLKAKPTDMGDIVSADAASTVVNKYKERQQSTLLDEAEYMAQWGLTYGASVWQVGWDRQLAMREVEIDLDRMAAALVEGMKAAQQAAQQGQPPDPEMEAQLLQIQQFLSWVGDPSAEDLAANAIQENAAAMAAQLFEEARMEYGSDWLKNYKIGPSKARKAVRELRETGRTKIAAPYLARNEPCVTARQVGYDIILPPETTELQRSSWITVREWLTPAEIEEQKSSDGWDPEWCEAALKTAGMVTVWSTEIAQADMADDATSTSTMSSVERTDSGLVEVLTTQRRCVSPEGVPQVWATVWSAHCMASPDGSELVGKHYALDLPRGNYPFVGYRARKTRRAFQEAIGIAEMVGSDQAAVKSTVDKLLDRSEVELNPPWKVRSRLAMRYQAGPGSQVSQGRPGDVEPMEPPKGSPALGFELIRMIELRLARRYGQFHPEVPPSHTTTKLQAATDRFLTSCAEMFTLYFSFIQQYASPAELRRIADGANFPTDPGQIAGEYDLSLWFDVKDLDFELVFKKLEGVLKLAVPLDRTGRIDMGRLVSIILEAIDPKIAALVTRDPKDADTAIKRQVEQDMAMMFLGNPPDLVENDPTAAQQLGVMRQILQGDPITGTPPNVLYQAALSGQPAGGSPQFPEFLQLKEKNLTQSVVQDQNKERGRKGV